MFLCNIFIERSRSCTVLYFFLRYVNSASASNANLVKCHQKNTRVSAWKFQCICVEAIMRRKYFWVKVPCNKYPLCTRVKRPESILNFYCCRLTTAIAPRLENSSNRRSSILYFIESYFIILSNSKCKQLRLERFWESCSFYLFKCSDLSADYVLRNTLWTSKQGAQFFRQDKMRQKFTKQKISKEL